MDVKMKQNAAIEFLLLEGSNDKEITQRLRNVDGDRCSRKVVTVFLRCSQKVERYIFYGKFAIVAVHKRLSEKFI
jgi:hypothetical protein